MNTALKLALLSSGAFSPLALGPALWLEASDLTTMFQSNAGTGAVAADGDPVGTWNDKSGNGFHLTSAADDTTRPLYKTSSGLHWVEGDGVNDVLRRVASLGMYAAGAYSVFLAVRGNPAADTRLVAEGSSSSNNPIHSPVQSLLTDAADSEMFVRDDAGVVAIAHSVPLVHDAWNNVTKVYGITDDNGSVATYVNGAADTTVVYVRPGTAVTVDRFALFALLRAAAGSFFAGRVYALVVVKRVLAASERAALTRYLGSKAGLSL